MYKFGRLEGNNWVEHVYPVVFSAPASEQELQRLVVGVSSGKTEVFDKLVESLEPPFYLLYVLHTTRGEELAGRYQSPLVSATEFRRFLEKFAQYFSSDARFDLWVHSPAENATVVWDRHNQVFAYGPLPRYKLVLQGLGFSQESLEIPAPHVHNYHEELDSQAALVLKAFEWIHSPLHQEDQQ